jgi:hypothetical protein
MTESEVAYPVDIETVAGAVDAGETLTVDVTVENEGSEPGRPRSNSPPPATRSTPSRSNSTGEPRRR